MIFFTKQILEIRILLDTICLLKTCHIHIIIDYLVGTYYTIVVRQNISSSNNSSSVFASKCTMDVRAERSIM